MTIDEGLCVQIMHLGSFDDEPKTVALMDAYLEQNGYVNDVNRDRSHHEIYLSDARKVAPEKRKTVIRHPIKKREIPAYQAVIICKYTSLHHFDGGRLFIFQNQSKG